MQKSTYKKKTVEENLKRHYDAKTDFYRDNGNWAMDFGDDGRIEGVRLTNFETEVHPVSMRKIAREVKKHKKGKGKNLGYILKKLTKNQSFLAEAETNLEKGTSWPAIILIFLAIALAFLKKNVSSGTGMVVFSEVKPIAFDLGIVLCVVALIIFFFYRIRAKRRHDKR